MKRAVYSIDDEEFAVLLQRTHDVLVKEKLPYMFVGGVATQAHIINYLSKVNGKTLQELVESADIRVQDHLRATDDADITLDTREIGDQAAVGKKVLDVLQEIIGSEGCYISLSGNHLVSMSLERTGIKRPVFRLGLDKEANDPESAVSFNFYFGPKDTNQRWHSEMAEFEAKNYFVFFDNSQELSLPYSKSGKNLVLRVKSPEALLATKIARDREKDWNDILLLARHSHCAGIPINYAEVEKFLCGPNPVSEVPNMSLVEKYEKFRTIVGLDVKI